MEEQTGEFDIQKAREFIQKKRANILRERHQRFEKAWHDFDNIVALLIKRYDLKQIYQWGSLLNEKYFSEISDIDIAVEGVKSAEQYFQMIGEAMELTDFPLDLVDIEKVDPVYAEGIRKRGRLIYERK
jgi:predicted nucleotidyltransferase